MLKQTRIYLLFLLIFSGLLSACSSSEPEIKEIESALAQEAEFLLGRPDPNNFGLSLQGMIKAYDFKKVRGYMYGDKYMIKVDYKVKLTKSAGSMTLEQRQAAKASFGSSEKGTEKTIKSHELFLKEIDGRWLPSHFAEIQALEKKP